MNKSDEEEITDDIYAFFNIKRDASTDEINNAFRRLSKIYHPDKHTDPELKQKAEQLFNKTRKYYDILINEQKRAVYDTAGGKVINSLENMQLVEVDKSGKRMTADQIRSEYDRLVRKRENELFQERTNPQGNITVNINACNLFRPSYALFDYADEDDYDARIPVITKLTIEQSVEAPASVKDRFLVGGSLTADEGYGSGNMSLTWQRIVGPSIWAQTQVSIGDAFGASFKCYGPLFKSFYGVAQFAFQYSDGIIVPGWVFGMQKQLEKHWVGSISLNLSAQQTITTSLTYDDIFSKRFLVSCVVGKPSSFLLLSYTHRFRENDARIKAVATYGTQGFSAQLGYHRKISTYSDAGFTCRFAYPAGITLKLRWVRANQQYAANIKICDDVIYPSAVVYSIIIPILLYNTAKLVLNPYLDRNRRRLKTEKFKKATASQDAKRKEAEITAKLMTSFAERVVEIERSSNGLIIIEAHYGYFSPANGIASTSSNSYPTEAVADVRIPLQAMVKNSNLILQESPKWQLAGFYDPCLGKDKLLRITYECNSQLHRVTIRDDEGLNIPKNSHKVSPTGRFEDDITKDD